MTIQDLGSLGEFIAAIATLGTLIYLALQIRQNSQTVKAQTRSNIAADTYEIILRQAENPQIIAIQSKSQRGEKLTYEENSQLRLLAAATFRLWENIHFQYRQGLYEHSEFETQRDTWGRLVSDGWLKNYWSSMSRNFSQEFRNLLDDFESRA